MGTPRTCAVSGCNDPVRAKGLCNRHYRRQLRTGDPLKAAWERGDPVANFWAKVHRRGDDDCWLWAGYVNRDGYGKFIYPGGQLAYRYAYELLIGPIPDGHDLDHVCHSEDLTCRGGRACPHRRCVNPAHLRAKPVLVNRGALTHKGDRTHAGAHHREKTHCPRGHPYNEANTYVDKRGSRNCRACRRTRT